MNPNDVTPSSLSTYTPQEDSSEYIRTYARDVAMLTKTPPAAASSAPSVPTSSGEVSEGVQFAAYDPSPVNHPDDSSPKEFKQEVVDLQASDSDGIFSSAQQQAPEVQPLIPHEPVAITSSVSTSPFEQQSSPLEEQPNDEREAILARLHARLDNQESPQVIPDSEPEPAMRTAAPTFEQIPEPVVPIPQVAERTQPVASPTVVQPEGSPLHTFSSDFANRIDTQQASTFAVLAQDSDAGQNRPRAAAPRRRIFPLVAGTLMLLIGIGAIVGGYLYMNKEGVIPIVQKAPSLITYDESVEVKGMGQDLQQAVANVAQGANVSGNVIVTYVTTISTSTSGIPQPGGVLINHMSLGAPDILLRNIDESSTVGTIHAGSESRPFMILKVDSYERTFAGMLAWEATMPQDLGIFYPPYADQDVPATTTASTTQVTSLSQPAFTDAIVDNYDVRVLRDQSGRSLIIYGYKGKGTLIIARDEAAFSALVARLSAQGL